MSKFIEELKSTTQKNKLNAIEKVVLSLQKEIDLLINKHKAILAHIESLDSIDPLLRSQLNILASQLRSEINKAVSSIRLPEDNSTEINQLKVLTDNIFKRLTYISGEITNLRRELYASEDNSTTQGDIENLRSTLSQVRKELKTLKAAQYDPVELLNKINLPVQRSLSIPVKTDEGGLGTTTRPTSGQVPIADSNGNYQPGAVPASNPTYIAVTATYAALTTDAVIDCTSGSFTVTLPTAVGVVGKTYIIKNSGTGKITLATTSAQTIDAIASAAGLLRNQYQYVQLTSDGANWKITGGDLTS